MRQKLNQLKAGVILSYTTMAVQSISAIAYTPIMLRLLGKSEYGVYSLVYSVVSYLGVLSFGLDSAYIRFYSRFQAKNDEEGMARLNGMFLTLFTLISLISLAAGAVLTENAEALFGGGLTETEIRTAKILMELMVFNIAVTFPSTVFDSIVTVHEQYIFQKIVNLMRAVLNPFLALPLLLMGYKSIGLVLVTTFLTLTDFFLNIWFCLKKLKTRFLFSRFNLALLKEIWIFSFYIFLNMITDQANWNVDKFILGKIKGSSDVAVYSIGSQFNNIYLTFSTAISSVFVPKVNRIVAESGDMDALTNLFTKIGRIQFLVLSYILTGFFFFGSYFMKVWAGKEYTTTYITAYQIALLLMVPVTVPLIQNLGIGIQIAKNMHKFRSVVYALIAAANIVVSVLLCPVLGGVGCAIGTAAALTIGSGFVMNWYYQKRVGLDIKFFWKQILGFFPALLPPVAFGIFIAGFYPIVSVFRFLVYGVVYTVLFFFSMWKFGMNPYEKDLALQPMRKVAGRLARRPFEEPKFFGQKPLREENPKKYLIVVPHPDDEINVAGQLIAQLTRSKNEVFVLFTTNGDYFPDDGEKRLKEALRALELLGVKERNILFMGYGDGWKGEKHLYNTEGDSPMESRAGRTETYGLETHPEYRFQKSGHHHTYTRNHYKKDMKEILLDLTADVLIAVDFDRHPDHRCTSLMFEEVLGGILKETEGYAPVVLKKFAYAGVWNGPKDYFSVPPRPTCPPRKELLNDARFELDVPGYTWEERVRFSAPKESRTLWMHRNILYKAEGMYRSQAAKWRTDRICSADVVYWQRRTESLTYRAEIEVSSGNLEFLNDFKRIDCPDIKAERKGIEIFGDCVWVPDRDDAAKEIRFTFREPVTVSRLCLYENFSPGDHIQNGALRLDNGFSAETGPLNPSGSKTAVEFEAQRGIRQLTFQITEFTGNRPGLTEIEIYEKNEDTDFSFLAEPYFPDENTKRFPLCLLAPAARLLFETGRFFYRAEGRLRKGFRSVWKHMRLPEK